MRCRFHHSLPDAHGDHVGSSVLRVNVWTAQQPVRGCQVTLLATSPCLEHSPCQEAHPQLFSALSRNRARCLRLSHLPELTCLVTDVTALAALSAPAAAAAEPLVPASAIDALRRRPAQTPAARR